MKNIKLFEEFVHTNFSTINELIDLRNYDCIYNQTPESVKQINKILKINKFKIIKLFHGTHPSFDIINEGLKMTNKKSKRSLQSESGYVYLSIYPESAKLFGDLSYGISNSQVYEIHVPIIHLKPDKDQLFNMKQAHEFYIGDTLGDSAIYGHGFRIKGDIPPYMISKYNL